MVASTRMSNCTAAMIDWWLGWVHHTEQYKLWHPRDHIFSGLGGPRDNNSTYIGGNELAKLKTSFRDPSEYFGPSWRDDFQRSSY